MSRPRLCDNLRTWNILFLVLSRQCPKSFTHIACVMQSVGNVIADPFPSGTCDRTKCFACPTSDCRKPALKVVLNSNQVKVRALVDTGNVPNPFLRLDADAEQEIFLCTPCRDKQSGWVVICNPRRYGRENAQKALQAWRARCLQLSGPSSETPKTCFICCSLPTSERTGSVHEDSEEEPERNPTTDWTLYHLICEDNERFREEFTADFCRRANCTNKTVETLLKDPSEVRLCSTHLNHSRYAQNNAKKRLMLKHRPSDALCVFAKHGCVLGERAVHRRLWRLPVFDVNSLSELEPFSQLEETVFSHSNGNLRAQDVMGSACCRGCRYVVLEGKNCSVPIVSIESLSLYVDRCVVRSILFALDRPSIVADSIMSTAENAGGYGRQAKILRASCKLSNGAVEESVRMLPFQEVVRLRRALISADSGVDIQPDISDRTLEKRIQPVLAAKGVILKRLSYRLRCYIRVEQIDTLLSRMANSNTSSTEGISRPSINAMRSDLTSLGQYFGECQERYWNGDWSLSKEISNVPARLWTDFVLLMASNERIRTWDVAAKSTGVNIRDSFPISNDISVLPAAIEEELNKNTEYCRADLLICIRTLKVIEQTVMSHTKSVAGPLTITTSVSGICEVSPSFVSVLNAMGLFLSYNVTERYRQSLVAERERLGPWNSCEIGNGSIPMLQFDNWDINPLHAVKADGKKMPRVNGSLMQGVTRGVKRKGAGTGNTGNKKVKMDSWKSPFNLGSREEFVKALTSPENALVLNQFNDVVFGLVALYRAQLVGGSLAKDSEYNTGTRSDFSFGADGKPLNFRSLLLSAFKPHGGKDVSGESDFLFDQHVVYVEISRDSAADTLTVRRFINLVQQQLTPGRPGSPRYVVLGGDGPSYKMYCEMWVESWRNSNGDSGQCGGDLPLHEWLIPFPGFFHAEKQAMYSLCKEMLDGLGLQEIAACAGLSNSHVSKIISHTHARNNRAVLFNLACAMIIHLVDIVLQEDATVAAAVLRLQNCTASKQVTTDYDALQRPVTPYDVPATNSDVDGVLYKETTSFVTADVIDIGHMLNEQIYKRFTTSPNGKHFVGTVLFTCLLPTIGFHVLSRTGHTDLTEAFWFKQNAILHSSTHLKYQKLSIFYAFFRGIIPSVVEDELYKDKPGRSVLKLPSFTGRGKQTVDGRGYTYVHQDEALEMLIVRQLKNLSVNLLGHLENSAAWLMQVSMFRNLSRYVTGASRSYGRRRCESDGGELPRLLSEFSRESCQWTTVSRIVHIMRDAGFMNAVHRGSEWLTNVFATPPKRMNNKKDQDSILSIAESGEATSAFHSSVLFPDVFGPLTNEDKEKHFQNRKFKRWTKCRAVPRASQSMAKPGGQVTYNDQEDSEFPVVVNNGPSLPKRPKSREAFAKALHESRRKLGKMKDAIYSEQRRAITNNNDLYLKELMERWDRLHESRYLISPFPDCFLNQEGRLNHANKSKFLKYTKRNNRDVVYTFNNKISNSGVRSERVGRDVSQTVYECRLPPYRTLQVDVMNALHYRGDTGVRGTSLKEVVTGKMKTVLRPWISGQSAKDLRQIHLHIDDPSIVISQKTAEQRRRDLTRLRMPDEGDELTGQGVLLSFEEELNVPWSTLMNDRGYKDELATLHLFCGAVAAFELLGERRHECTVFLHGGFFAVPTCFTNSVPQDYTPERSDEEESFKGRVVLRRRNEPEREGDLFPVPRSRCLIFRTSGEGSIGGSDIKHGEAETRFVATYVTYISPYMSSWSSQSGGYRQGGTFCESLILSDDTDVFLILLSNPAMHGKGVRHVLSDTVHDVDNALSYLRSNGTCGSSAAIAYCLGGCDYLPAMYGVGSELFLETLVRFTRQGGTLSPPLADKMDKVDTFVCFLYLGKHGKSRFCTEAERRWLANQAGSGQGNSPPETIDSQRAVFVSENDVGTYKWRLDVRNFIADKCKYSNELIPDFAHIRLQARRANFVAVQYWSRASEMNVSPEIIGGCSVDCGYDRTGGVVLDTVEDVKDIMARIKSVVISCNCKGDCKSRRCSCFRTSNSCVGCGCSDNICRNRQCESAPDALEVLEHNLTAGNSSSQVQSGAPGSAVTNMGTAATVPGGTFTTHDRGTSADVTEECSTESEQDSELGVSGSSSVNSAQDVDELLQDVDALL